MYVTLQSRQDTGTKDADSTVAFGARVVHLPRFRVGGRSRPLLSAGNNSKDIREHNDALLQLLVHVNYLADLPHHHNFQQPPLDRVPEPVDRRPTINQGADQHDNERHHRQRYPGVYYHRRHGRLRNHVPQCSAPPHPTDQLANDLDAADLERKHVEHKRRHSLSDGEHQRGPLHDDQHGAHEDNYLDGASDVCRDGDEYLPGHGQPDSHVGLLHNGIPHRDDHLDFFRFTNWDAGAWELRHFVHHCGQAGDGDILVGAVNSRYVTFLLATPRLKPKMDVN